MRYTYKLFVQIILECPKLVKGSPGPSPMYTTFVTFENLHVAVLSGLSILAVVMIPVMAGFTQCYG